MLLTIIAAQKVALAAGENTTVISLARNMQSSRLLWR